MKRRQLLCLFGSGLAGCSPPPPTRPALSLGEVLGGGDMAGFARATAVREFVFPADHGPHPDFRNEWWYLTGNLQAADGRRFGYQATFFNAGLPRSELPAAGSPQSAWRSERLWMAHLALTDVEAGRHYAAERFARESPGLAGAQAEPLQIWLEDWQLAGGEAARFPWQLRAATSEFGFDFQLVSVKPPVLQGEDGLSRKHAAPGAASYYYSLTRLQTRGALRLGPQTLTITGSSWLDREWSTSALAPEQIGWDWFSLQFDDGRELMYYQLRRRDGSSDPFSQGSWTGPDASQTRVAPSDLQLQELRQWQAPDGVTYTTVWRLQLAEASYRLEALVEAQYMALSIPYWEGAVRIIDEGSGLSAGHGYLEMVRQ
jgi:predicted secreted hydrolase